MEKLPNFALAGKPTSGPIEAKLKSLRPFGKGAKGWERPEQQIPRRWAPRNDKYVSQRERGSVDFPCHLLFDSAAEF